MKQRSWPEGLTACFRLSQHLSDFPWNTTSQCCDFPPHVEARDQNQDVNGSTSGKPNELASSSIPMLEGTQWRGIGQLSNVVGMKPMHAGVLRIDEAKSD